MVDEKRVETKSLSDLLRDAVEARLCDVHTSMPGTIVSYDPEKNLAVVQPQIKRKYKTEDTAINLPLITNVPVIFPRSKKFHLYFPLESGDQGEILFQERSIDLWYEQGNAVDPNDKRKFSLSDGVFIPGLFAKNTPITRKGDPTSFEIKYNETYLEIKQDSKVILKNPKAEVTYSVEGDIQLKGPVGIIDLKKDGEYNYKGENAEVNAKPNGKFKVTNQVEELFDLLVQTIDLLSTTTTNTVFGPMQLNDFAQFAILKTKMESLKG